MDLTQETVLFRTDRHVVEQAWSPWRKSLTGILLSIWVVFMTCLSAFSLLFAVAGIWFLLPFLPALPDWITINNSFEAIFAACFGVAVCFVIGWVILDLTLRIETRIVIDPPIGEMRWESRYRHREDKIDRLPLSQVTGFSVKKLSSEGGTCFTLYVVSSGSTYYRAIWSFDDPASASAEADRLGAALRSAGWSGETPLKTAPETQ